MSAKKIYVASPLGFSDAGRDFYYNKLIPLINENSFEVLDPWSLTPVEEIKRVEQIDYGNEKKVAWQELNFKIGERNINALDQVDYVLAVLDGVDVDSGTASEIGYAFAKGKKIVGYRGDFRLSADNEGSVVNIQVEYFIRKSGGEIVSSVEEIPSALMKILDD